MEPLKSILESHTEMSLDRFYAETAWSHFAIVIMFGLLEVAVKVGKGIAIEDFLGDKGREIKAFFVKYLDVERQTKIAEDYKPIDDTRKLTTFEDVVQDMWDEYRSGFVHSVGVHSVPHEPVSFGDGGEKDGIPVIAISKEVPVFTWLIITWQAIFKSLGFKGNLNSN
ncbi:hypothetical protein IPM19_03850 [bacterium]|nr:MAG: hypothetical protein IPM19_03850 [bacterium]